MSDEVEVTTTEAVKKMSDGMVKISIEKYEGLLDTVAEQRVSIANLRDELTKLRLAPPVVNRTVIHKTAEMIADDHKVWGATFMGTGAILFGIGALRYKAGKS